MNEHQPSRRVSRAIRFYAWFLRLYPAAHRQAYDLQMLQTFQDHYHDAIETKGESQLLFWLGVVGDESKSVVREQQAALRERRFPMKKPLPLTLVALTIVLIGFGFLFGGRHMDGLFMLAPGVALYTLLLVILARFVRAFPRAAAKPTWLRLGLVLGGSVALYVVVITAMIALLPVPTPFAVNGGDVRYNLDTVLDLSLPLLAGMVGVMGGYVRGSARTGALLGLLTGFLALVVAFASQALLIVLLWNALQQHQLQSRLAWDYQGWLQVPGWTPALGNFLNWEIAQEGIELTIFVCLILLAVQAVAATIGGALGAGAFRRANNAAEAAALPAPMPGQARFLGLPVKFTLTILGLGLLTWGLYAGLSLLGWGSFSLSTLGGSFASPAFLAWLLVGLVVLVAVLVTARPGSAQQEASAAAG